MRRWVVLVVVFGELVLCLSSEVTTFAGEGKQWLEKWQREAKVSDCWLQAISNIEESCDKMDHNSRSKLALHLSNCHFIKSGLPAVPCTSSMTAMQCLEQINADSVRYTTFTTFSVYTDEICVYLQSENNMRRAQETMSGLYVASQEAKSTLADLQQSAGSTLQSQEALAEKQKELEQKIAGFSEEQNKAVAGFREEFVQLGEASRRLDTRVAESLTGQQKLLDQQALGMEQHRAFYQETKNFWDWVAKHNELNVAAVERVLQLQALTVEGQQSLETRQRQLQSDAERALGSVSQVGLSLDALTEHQASAFRDIHDQSARTVALMKTQSALQQELMGAVDQLQWLQRMALGDLFDVKALVFYIAVATLGWFFTATERTKAARLWVMLVVGMTLVAERALCSDSTSVVMGWNVYDFVWTLRKAAVGAMGLCVLFAAATHRDYNRLNYNEMRRLTAEVENVKRELHEMRENVRSLIGGFEALQRDVSAALRLPGRAAHALLAGDHVDTAEVLSDTQEAPRMKARRKPSKA